VDEQMRAAVEVEKLCAERDVAGEADRAVDTRSLRATHELSLEWPAPHPRQAEAPRILPLQSFENLDEQERVLFLLEPSDGEQLDAAVPLVLRHVSDDVRLTDQGNGHAENGRALEAVAARDLSAHNRARHAAREQVKRTVEPPGEDERRLPSSAA